MYIQTFATDATTGVRSDEGQFETNAPNAAVSTVVTPKAVGVHLKTGGAGATHPRDWLV